MSDKNITYFKKIEFSLVFTNYIYLSHIIDIIEQFHPCNIDTEKCVFLADICILNSFRNICPLNFSTYNIYYSCFFFFPPVDVHRGWMMAMRDLFFKILWHMRMQRERGECCCVPHGTRVGKVQIVLIFIKQNNQLLFLKRWT